MGKDMELQRLAIAEVLLITPRRFADERGYFSETYSRRALEASGINTVFVQDNLSMSHRAGTVRGLHYQRPPHAQAKLVFAVRGRIFDVAVDVRRGSPTYGMSVCAELSAENGHQIFVPEGFLHGYATLEPDTLVAYKASAAYAPQCDGAVRWNDADLSIAWPVSNQEAILSPKDAQAPLFANFESPFVYDRVAGDVA
ncbi:MAG TPA: dTDP-4-dehydrorhamnose 3,5-epimerase [Caulobacteraceae bacterium]|jgi:dTDP-4-dehydrorhamnose 3,5-epimerase|nr:dTDP-4-dehydrorhamnose 3,5-epimerase [Caulobacteraceae bacterium]